MATRDDGGASGITTDCRINIYKSTCLDDVRRLALRLVQEFNAPVQYATDNVKFLRETFEDVHGFLKECGTLLEALRSGNPQAELMERVLAAWEKADVDYIGEEVPNALDQTQEGLDEIKRLLRSVSHLGSESDNHRFLSDLNAAVETAMDLVENEVKFVARLVPDFDDRVPAVPCYLGELCVALINLLVNAGQAVARKVGEDTQELGVIRVSTRLADDYAEVTIADSGMGIEPDAQGRIFEPGFTTRGNVEGSGNGLFIARVVIEEKHGGTIHFESEPGRGTTFHVRLPLQEGRRL